MLSALLQLGDLFQDTDDILPRLLEDLLGSRAGVFARTVGHHTPHLLGELSNCQVHGTLRLFARGAPPAKEVSREDRVQMGIALLLSFRQVAKNRVQLVIVNIIRGIVLDGLFQPLRRLWIYLFQRRAVVLCWFSFSWFLRKEQSLDLLHLSLY